jgi:hypothetical protein
MVINDNVNVICSCILLVILYLLYYYYVNTYEYTEEFNNNNYFDLKYDTPMNYNMEKMVCSKSCCSTQWPTSGPTQVNDPKIDMNEYLPTNLNCNDGIHDTGCICKKKTI